MCGILYINNTGYDLMTVTASFKKIQHRGPDVSYLLSHKRGEYMGFHRLSINGSSEAANQPMSLDNQTYLLCNGEIYNHEILQQKYNIVCTTGSDCEIILHLFPLIGFEQTVRELDGEFALVLVTPQKVYAARDPYGVRAMYMADTSRSGFGLASEGKALYDLFPAADIMQFPPGTLVEWTKETGARTTLPYYNFTYKCIADSAPGDSATDLPADSVNICYGKLHRLLAQAVEKRLMCSRTHIATCVPTIGAYLSGGFDSSAIAALLRKSLAFKFDTFSIGFEGSPDLFYARKVADYIGSNHHEYIITEAEALAAIPEVIQAIESYDITTVRASTMMYLLSKYVKRDTNVVVMFSGEGSDEASGSYRYFHNAPNATEFHQETERLLKDLCYFDNLRADKSSAAWGLEIRVPFLDIEFLQYYMTLPASWKTQNGLEKYLLRKAMEGYLPNSVLYRVKEAMSDGVSLHGRSWSTIIQEEAMRCLGTSQGLQAERSLYLSLFKKYYAGCEKQIPYYWLPKWCGDVQDPSARVLAIYNA
jgi:asparagine synthase (glutamine-hydrolysing)